jgi:hypothetical protein
MCLISLELGRDDRSSAVRDLLGISGLVSADRWREFEWRLAAQQQAKQGLAERARNREIAAERAHWGQI